MFILGDLLIFSGKPAARRGQSLSAGAPVGAASCAGTSPESPHRAAIQPRSAAPGDGDFRPYLCPHPGRTELGF